MEHMSRAMLILLPAIFCLPVVAEEKANLLYEITPFAGLRAGGDFELDTPSRKVDVDDSGSLALALNYRIDEVSQYELFYSRQATSVEPDPLLGTVDVDIEYLQLGGTVAMSDPHRFVPYLVGGLGATRFNADSAEADDETRFSISLGGGVRVPFSERFSVRVEGRGYLTLVDTDTAFFCRSDEGGALCRIRGSGSTFLQFELLAGAAFAF